MMVTRFPRLIGKGNVSRTDDPKKKMNFCRLLRVCSADDKIHCFLVTCCVCTITNISSVLVSYPAIVNLENDCMRQSY